MMSYIDCYGWVWFLLLAIKVALAFIPADIAKKRGYSFGGFWVLGFIFFLVGLIVALRLDSKPGSVKYAQPVYYPPQTEQVRTEFSCADCGTPYRQGDAFCANCGSKLTV